MVWLAVLIVVVGAQSGLAVARSPDQFSILLLAQTPNVSGPKATNRDVNEIEGVGLSGTQKEALSASVADRATPGLMFRSAADAQRWVDAMDSRLQSRIPEQKLRAELLRTIHYEATRAALDPQLVLSLIDVQSGFRKYAVSNKGARGYMQVMPAWIKVIGEPHHNLFALRTNLRYGCTILSYYLDLEKGDTLRALSRYTGNVGNPAFPKLIHDAWRERWAYDGPTS